MTDQDQYQSLDHNVVTVYAMAKTVKIITIIDFITSLFFVFYSPYYIIPVAISIIGFCGAKYYKYCYILLYTILSLLSYIVRTSFLIYIKNQDNSWIFWDYVVIVMSTLFEMYLMRYLVIFYNKMKNLNETEYNELDTIHERAIQYIYW